MSEMKCPVTGKTRSREAKQPTKNKDWWPNQLDLKVLHQNSPAGNPMGEDFDYAKAFEQLDYEQLKQDLFKLMNDSQDWWPADYGHYGPFFIRMAWHSAGTYRMSDGRGGANDGTQRFAPLNSWPDNVNLDKARRLLWPIKKKYGKSISWADLMILAGNCALESMGVPIIGFAGGREDVWEPQEDVNWGSEETWLSNEERYDENKKLDNPLAAVEMGLIYVNPEGPNGMPDAVASGKDVRDTFRRMAMNDTETVALIAGGHTFGKSHGAGPATHVGPEPEAAPIENMGLGWKSTFGKGHSEDTIGSGIEGAWKPHPTTYDMGYFETLFKYDWNLVKSPAGAFQWVPTDPEAAQTVEDAHIPGKFHAPMMTTADLSLRYDAIYNPIAKHFHHHPDEFNDAFTKAWFKLTHRDLGPHSRYLGHDIPKETFIWQDPIPARDHELVEKKDVDYLKEAIKNSGLSMYEKIYTAWSSASTFRGSDFRGGANGSRIRFAPQKSWTVNQPDQLAKVLDVYTNIQEDFNQSQTDGKKVSLADLIVLGGNQALEEALENAQLQKEVPFTPGRMDALLDQTDVDSFHVLEPKADGFRNYYQDGLTRSQEEMLLDKAQLLGLSAPEMSVLLGGLRTLGITFGSMPHGVLTKQRDRLDNDFFVNLLDMNTIWKPLSPNATVFEGLDYHTKERKWTATRVDLIFGSHSQLRAIAEVYASDDAKEKFADDFIAAWNKVMNADRFDIKE